MRFTPEYLRALGIDAPFGVDLAEDTAAPAAGKPQSIRKTAKACPRGPYVSTFGSLYKRPSHVIHSDEGALHLTGRCLKGKVLIVAPPSVLNEWIDAIAQAKTPQKVMRWEGTQRHILLGAACHADFVLVSTAQLNLDANMRRLNAGPSNFEAAPPAQSFDRICNEGDLRANLSIYVERWNLHMTITRYCDGVVDL